MKPVEDGDSRTDIVLTLYYYWVLGFIGKLRCFEDALYMRGEYCVKWRCYRRNFSKIFFTYTILPHDDMKLYASLQNTHLHKEHERPAGSLFQRGTDEGR